MTDYYAGIGSRDTPDEVCELMTGMARALRERGFILRSGHAPGADQAFEKGADSACQIFVPWDGFEDHVPLIGVKYSGPSIDAMELAREFHPAWNRCGRAARLFHARNCHQVLGPDLNDPVRFVLCWTKNGKKAGGTAQAMRIAEHYGIPITNMGTEEGMAEAINNIL